mmetsp:Transcript_41107/g.96954  ORF Transcript_41107/g.96954 Transcript_41107/m.96954 type:complete len:228 (+) Transcript_41107:286-969(+)
MWRTWASKSASFLCRNPASSRTARLRISPSHVSRRPSTSLTLSSVTRRTCWCTSRSSSSHSAALSRQSGISHSVKRRSTVAHCTGLKSRSESNWGALGSRTRVWGVPGLGVGSAETIRRRGTDASNNVSFLTMRRRSLPSRSTTTTSTSSSSAAASSSGLALPLLAFSSSSFASRSASSSSRFFSSSSFSHWATTRRFRSANRAAISSEESTSNRERNSSNVGLSLV